MKFILPSILIAIAVVMFFVLSRPLYDELSVLRKEVSAYDEALTNSKALENERDKLTAKYNSFNREDLERLEKLLPENVDNIRLILEIEQLASPYGMALRNVKYNAASANTAPTAGNVVAGGTRPQTNTDYGTLDLEFTTSSSYQNFVSFLEDLESNLRIIDIASITFSSNTATGPSASEVYEYTFKIRTYWLKN